jgi:hypothetical protein
LAISKEILQVKDSYLAVKLIVMTAKIIMVVCLFLGVFFGKIPERKTLSEDNKQFIYVLRYTPEFKQAIKWTAKENQVGREHILYIKALIGEKKAYVLGRTTNMYDPELFGIVIFDAPNIEDLRSNG